MTTRLPFNGTSNPYIRWWWLSGPFTEPDIIRQLDWVAANGFGGVELAWLEPGWLEEDESDRQRPEWLGTEWSRLVAFTKQAASRLGLGCDFTFGSVWPFGGSWVKPEDALQTFLGPSRQRVRGTWEQAPPPEGVYVVNHLSASALRHYAEPLLRALAKALDGPVSALFCDSLEIDTHELWSAGLWQQFRRRFGYSLRPYASHLDGLPQIRYDYRRFIAQVIQREFYQAFTAICHVHGALARVQCHGAPADLLAAYASVDIPESEALLFPPAFSRIAASAAAWSGKPVVSAEAFTCIYGFPGREPAADDLWKQEDIRDLKLLADSLFAHGVNHLVWHGMPFQPAGKEVEFYASVHVGPDSPFSNELLPLNHYFTEVCSAMKSGEPYGGIGVYLPWEDALMEDHLPPELRTPGAKYVWEMRYALPPAETEGYHPIWISLPFLQEAQVENGAIHSRNLRLAALYVDSEWVDFASLKELTRLQRAGAVVICKRLPREPGRKQHTTYSRIAETLSMREIPATLFPLLSGRDIPCYWARVVGDTLLLFLANPITKRIRYPMQYQLAAEATGPIESQLVLTWAGHRIPLSLRFESYQSILLRADRNGLIEYVPIGALQSMKSPTSGR